MPIVSNQLKFFKVFLTFTLIAISLGVRIDINSPESKKFQEQFDVANKAEGNGISKIAFTGDASFFGARLDFNSYDCNKYLGNLVKLTFQSG